MPSTLPKEFLRHLLQLLEQTPMYLDGDLDELERISYHFEKYTTGSPEIYHSRTLAAIPILLTLRYAGSVGPWVPMDVRSVPGLRGSLQKMEDELAGPWLMEHRLLNDHLGELHDERMVNRIRIAHKVLDAIEKNDDALAGWWLAEYVMQIHLSRDETISLVQILLEGL